ncbi:hypothetical protein GBF38_008973 [Nibea albiflora]|uniref:Uncharacterized protein n=1 Tax=Nibea albiflora TaxID=240163 RepID=A0ACB7ES65_NIBAL|nr:hypothetical protein GBF38_008973 [Nibea albiflora]
MAGVGFDPIPLRATHFKCMTECKRTGANGYLAEYEDLKDLMVQLKASRFELNLGYCGKCGCRLHEDLLHGPPFPGTTEEVRTAIFSIFQRTVRDLGRLFTTKLSNALIR